MKLTFFFIILNFCIAIISLIIFIKSTINDTSVNNEKFLYVVDEEFHIPQAQRIIKHPFEIKKWRYDPKLTTPPGLYFVSLFFSYLFGSSIWALRSENIVGSCIILPVIFSTIKNEKIFNSKNIYIITSFPLLFFFNLLYYTDVWSTICVLTSLAFTFKKKYAISSLFAWFSLWFRQTNVIWTFYIALIAISHDYIYKENNNSQSIVGKNKFYFNILFDFSIKSIYKIHRIIGHIMVCISFILFVKYWNNGRIVLGDASNHKVGLHFPQLFYFFTFTMIFSWPLWFFPGLNSYSKNIFIKFYKSNFNSKHSLYRTLLIIIIMIVLVKNFTIVHPFMLADNRHYVFYIWRKIINKKWWCRYALIPIYFFSGWVVINSATDTENSKNKIKNFNSVSNNILCVGWFFCTILVLVPSPLIEFRYYIVPYLLWRLLIVQRNTKIVLIEWMWYMAINLIVLYMFINKTFIWHSEPGKVQRIMW